MNHEENRLPATIRPRQRRLSWNLAGRDFVVGDIHGMFRELEALLATVAFDPTVDRLLAVGDLIDRGRDSLPALAYLGQSWFHSILGNHEQILLDAQGDVQGLAEWVTHNGGQWWLSAEPSQQAAFVRHLLRLPLALEVATAVGRLGIIHADVPPGLDWATFVLALDRGDPQATAYALWSRKRVLAAQQNGRIDPVPGIDAIVCGHTPLRQATHLSNFFFIDTGATYWRRTSDAKLTLLQVHPQLQVFSQSCLTDPD